MKRMPPCHIFWLCVLVLNLVVAASSPAAAITSWTKSTGTTATNLNSDSPILGNGTTNSANATLISASIGSYTLASVGDSLTFNGGVSFTGLSGTLAHNFRWGLFNTNGSSTTKGWLGYVTQNSSGATVGDLYERDSGNNSDWWSATGATKDTSATAASNAVLADGNYTFSISLTLSAANTVSVAWSLTSTDSAYSLSGSYVDTTPQGLTFTTVGVGNAGFNASEIDFSNMSIAYSAVPEPSLSLLGLLGLSGLCWLRRKRTI